jgi:hypothetical protein
MNEGRKERRNEGAKEGQDNVRATYIVARSRNHCCHGNATISSTFIVVGVHVAVNDIKVFSFVMEMQQWIPFALLSGYKIFRTSVNTNKY